MRHPPPALREVPAGLHLATGALVATVAMLLTHPVAVAGTLALALAYAHAAGVRDETAWVHRAALGIGLAVVAFNALFSWNGATLIWEAPFRITLLGRPRLTLEAIAWGTTAGAQLATTVLALGTATLTVPPDALHRALARAGLPDAVATAAGLALRMVPDTTKDAHAMTDALAARGVPTDGLRGKSEILVPLTARTLDRALVAERALLMRGYDETTPTPSPPTTDATAPRPGTPTDAAAPSHDAPPATRLPAGWTALAGAGLAVAIAWIGPGRAPYYPTIDPALDLASLALVALALAPAALLVREVTRCSR